MNIALLGYGKEGQATEKYFKSHFDAECDVFENFTRDEIVQKDFSKYDYVFRSPSVPPLGLKNETSVTRYFFDHCPCTIIGVTATKGKGTTCSFIKSLLDAHGEDAYLIGNIGEPAINILDDLAEGSVVVYEMSSFQLWDLKQSPHIAVIGHLEPDHLNVHTDYQDYLGAKAHITEFQTASDYLVYNQGNSEAVKIAEDSKATLVPYPFDIPSNIASAIKLPGQHNVGNAIAAIAAVASFYDISPDEYLRECRATIIEGLAGFWGLPHRLEFLRELNGVKYYDDNFSTNPSSTRVAVESFPNENIVIVVGGRDKTDYADLPEIDEILQAKNIRKIILIGESGHEMARRYQDERFILVESLEEAVATLKVEAERFAPAVALMSPAAASFDMFKNVYDRGGQFQQLIKSLS